MKYKDAKEESILSDCRSCYEAFRKDGTCVLENASRACFAHFANDSSLNVINIEFVKYDPSLSIENNHYLVNDTEYNAITDLNYDDIVEVLENIKPFVDFRYEVIIDDFQSRFNKQHIKYVVHLEFDSNVNKSQKLFVCTCVRWFYEKLNRYVLKAAIEFYHQDKYHHFGLLNMYCIVKSVCYYGLNSTSHDIIIANSYGGTGYSINVISGLLTDEYVRTCLNRKTLLNKIYVMSHISSGEHDPLINTSRIYCEDSGVDPEVERDRLVNLVDWLISKLPENETFDSTNTE